MSLIGSAKLSACPCGEFVHAGRCPLADDVAARCVVDRRTNEFEMVFVSSPLAVAADLFPSASSLAPVGFEPYWMEVAPPSPRGAVTNTKFGNLDQWRTPLDQTRTPQLLGSATSSRARSPLRSPSPYPRSSPSAVPRSSKWLAKVGKVLNPRRARVDRGPTGLGIDGAGL